MKHSNFYRLVKLRLSSPSLLGAFVLCMSLMEGHVAMPQFYPNIFQGNPGGQSVPGLFPILGGNDNKNNGNNGGNGGWPFFGGLLSPQQQSSPSQGASPYGQTTPLRQDQSQQSPFSNPFFGGYPGFSNPWFSNPQQQQQQQQGQSPTFHQPAPAQSPTYQQPAQSPVQSSPYQPPQQQYQNPSYVPPSRQQPSYVNPSSYPTASQPPVSPSTYQNPNPPQQQQSYPTNSQWNPQPQPQPLSPPPVGGQAPPKVDDGQYRPEPYQPVPPKNEYAQNQPTLNVNGEPYGQQQQQEPAAVEEAPLVGDLRSNPQKDAGTSQQLLPAAGSAPGQGWVYPDDG